MSDEIEEAIKDSLKRQIVEVKRQIEQIKNRSKAKFLEIRRKTDQRKARLVLTTLKLKKQLQDCQSILEDSRRQWGLELFNSQDLIEKYASHLKQEKSLKIGKIYQILSQLSLDGQLRDSEYDETLEIDRSSEEVTIEHECSTDVVYLTTNLRAAIEGSTLDKLSSCDIIKMKLVYICRDVQRYIKSLQSEEIRLDTQFSRKSTEKREKHEKPAAEDMKNNGLFESPQIKVFHNSVFSFSSPELLSMHLSPIRPEHKHEASLSSEWEIDAELTERQEKNKQEDSARWNSISVIGLHSASISQGSEASESVELLQVPVQKATQTEFKKNSCWKRLFSCCFKGSR